MRIIKRLHLFLLKSFLPLFAMTFFIVLFIVLMQFLWRYIDDLVGKGLEMSVIAELFFYAAVSMVPMALPLAILLASLMTFGNLGERFELTAMKAAGISLVRVMAPLIVLISGIAVGAFFFQNDILPKAQVKMWTLLFSMRQKSPEVEIPEGVFYDQIPGINLFVSEKDRETGMLYDVKIYDVRRGGENVTILVSDSARMSLTGDMQYIYLNMYTGNQYEKMTANSGMHNDPFRRESFETKDILIPFDNNFNRLDEGGMREQYVGKNISELSHSIDSLNNRLDSIGRLNAVTIESQAFPWLATAGERTPAIPMKWNLDSMLNTLSPEAHNNIISGAIRDTEQRRNQILYEAQSMKQEKRIVRRHGIELLKKFTLSVACIIFFFIGAPLGAIIRKGGLGMPLVISVLLFLVYYIFDNTGYKMARDGHAPIWLGMWLSTFILAPLGIFVTYKAMNDSSVFDPDRIRIFFNRLLHRKEKRQMALKEVVINDIVPSVALAKINALTDECIALQDDLAGKRLLVGKRIARRASIVKENMEALIDYMHDSREATMIAMLNRYPVFYASRLMRVSVLRRYLSAIVSIDDQILGPKFLDLACPVGLSGAASRAAEEENLADSAGEEIEREGEPESVVSPDRIEKEVDGEVDGNGKEHGEKKSTGEGDPDVDAVVDESHEAE